MYVTNFIIVGKCWCEANENDFLVFQVSYDNDLSIGARGVIFLTRWENKSCLDFKNFNKTTEHLKFPSVRVSKVQ